MASLFPDRALAVSIKLPWPANRIAFATLRRLFQWRGRRAGGLTKIGFGAIEIEAPLDHPAVYWRYRPVGSNMNFVRLAEKLASVRDGIVVDVGANIGDGVALLRGNGVNSRVLAIEGDADFAELMRKNVGHLRGIEIAVCLLTDQEHDGLIMATSNGSGTPVKGTPKVPVITLDQLCQQRNIRQIALLKTDTDGFDAKVLRGAQSILNDVGPVVFAEVDDALLRQNGDCAAALIQFLEDSGYGFIIAWDNDGKLVDSRPIAQGVADLIERYPGGPNLSFIDVAAFKSTDSALFEECVVLEESRL